MTLLQFNKAKTISDFMLIEKLAYEIWYDRYDWMISKEQIEYMLNKFQRADVIEDDVSRGYNYYTVNTEKAVGYLGVQKQDNKLFLSKFYLKSETSGLGFGKQMFDFVEDCAIKSECNIIRLTVNKTNPAYKKYLSWGFKVVDNDVFDIGNGYVMDDYILEKTITK